MIRSRVWSGGDETFHNSCKTRKTIYKSVPKRIHVKQSHIACTYYACSTLLVYLFHLGLHHTVLYHHVIKQAPVAERHSQRVNPCHKPSQLSTHNVNILLKNPTPPHRRNVRSPSLSSMASVMVLLPALEEGANAAGNPRWSARSSRSCARSSRWIASTSSL